MSGTINWEALLAAATEATTHAYVPYSHYRVGAAALTEDGRVVVGCNVENAGYGVTLCAECGLVGQLAMTGGGKLRAFTCVNADGQVIMPCGRCRQLLSEHAGPDFEALGVHGVVSMEQLLPDAFGPADIA
ncbi:cytidine deaminase [Galactobacter caseinivorans]|uniref:Cytidine deaminase n=1 Tax=Galactobacter caseinivorans TaxID=2676123 RepID=A0A496PJB6_9MICC|nr:cytidine deaminase [Galactobacter caseinivorans]RKW70593.1 cytidine deaminase [Galactobacter caseinivorans]